MDRRRATHVSKFLSLVLRHQPAAESDEQRFAIRGDRIRASQGHSVAVDLGLAPAAPPPALFHGTVARFLPSIRRDGLVRGERTHVHLSADAETATRVALRSCSSWTPRRWRRTGTRSTAPRTASGSPSASRRGI